MAGEKVPTTEQQRTALAEKLWLAYFNQYLYEQSLITEAQRNRLALKIESHKASTSRPRKKRD